jgi:integrase
VKTETAAKPSRALPVPVVDFDAVLAEATAFADTHAYKPATVRAKRKGWRTWERVCADGGWSDPLKAPFDAFRDLILLRLEDGTPASPKYIECIANAVTMVYAEHGLTPAHRRPENKGEWRDLMRGLHRTHTKTATPARRKSPEDAVPLMRDEATRMLNTELPTGIPGLARKAGLLLVLDGITRPGRVSQLTRGDITIDNNGVTVDDTHVPCDHRERVRGVPWDCTACAVTDLLNANPHSDTPFQVGPQTVDRNTWSYIKKRIPGIETPTATDWGTAGTRRAVALRAAVEQGKGDTLDRDAYGLRWLRARAWTAIAWTCGLRMASDTTQLERSQAKPATDGTGWSLTLGPTKDDPGARKGVTRFFPWPEGDQVSVARILTEYLCVRDALVGPDGALIIDVYNGRGSEPLKKPVPVATRDLTLLATIAGLDPVYSSYSTRKGYAAQSAQDGASLEDIQLGLRHKNLATTLRHYVPGADGKTTAKKTIQAFDTIEEN